MGPWRQGAIAARPSATYKGYLMGGIAWFSIPFTMATTLGLCGRALDLPITIAESNNGLVPPAVATHLLGQGGSFLILLQLFMAVTASAASEQVGISSIVSYDIYKRYIAPNATGKQIVFVARCSIFAWACISGCLSIILNELKVRAGPDGPCRPPLPVFPFFSSRFVLLNHFPLVPCSSCGCPAFLSSDRPPFRRPWQIGLGWVYLAMGNFIGSAVLPVAFALTWKDCSAEGAMLGTWLGAGFSMLGWCLCANRLGQVLLPRRPP